MLDTSPLRFLNHSDVLNSLNFVGRTNSVLLFGVACLRRVWGRLDHDVHRTAADATEAFARHRLDIETLLAAWARADQFSSHELWSVRVRSEYFDDDGEGVEMALELRTASLLRSPSMFAANAALRARELSADAAEELAAQRRLYSDIIGPPFGKPDGVGEAHQSRHVREVVTGLDRTRDIDPVGMLALSDALEEAGCTDAEMLQHCRGGGQHHRGCWVVEELSGRSALRLPLSVDPAMKKKRPAPLIPMRRHAVRPPVRA